MSFKLFLISIILMMVIIMYMSVSSSYSQLCTRTFNLIIYFVIYIHLSYILHGTIDNYNAIVKQSFMSSSCLTSSFLSSRTLLSSSSYHFLCILYINCYFVQVIYTILICKSSPWTSYCLLLSFILEWSRWFTFFLPVPIRNEHLLMKGANLDVKDKVSV